jgi:tetratricopeptide (TPR) repeat protein
MMTSLSYKMPENLLFRDGMISLLEAALYSRTYRFARQAAITWLATYPGDAQVDFLLSCALLAEGKIKEGDEILTNLREKDPEQLEFAQLLLEYLKEEKSERVDKLSADVYSLGGRVHNPSRIPDWAHHLRVARNEMRVKNWESAQRSIDRALNQKIDSPLIAVTHLTIAREICEDKYTAELAALYHERFPQSVLVALINAEQKIKQGDNGKAIKLLHKCVADDPAGEMAERLWGSDHRFSSLWAENLSVYWDIPIPAEVAAQFGWNCLPQGEELLADLDEENINSETQVDADEQVLEDQPVVKEEVIEPSQPNAEKELDEDLKNVQEVFDKVAKRVKKPDIARTDGRFPVYVILTSQKALEAQYGTQTWAILLAELKALAGVVQSNTGWASLVYLPDSIESTEKLGLSLVDETNSWNFKLSLTDLDKKLASKGQMIGAVLIVGGDKIIPFHRLPNPTDDSDVEVLSDNPYATLDSNYFVPEWSVGRLPGEETSDAGLLLGQLRQLVRSYKAISAKETILQRIMQWMLGGRSNQPNVNFHSGLGYTAAVWKRSSAEVLKQTGVKSKLISSPPEFSGSLDPKLFTNQGVGYYNLHGLEDAAEWYGQPDVFESDLAPEYPIALSPKDLGRNGTAPQIVFTEACYGGYINGKKEDESIALRFLSIGVPVVIGSSCISYGSVTTPLIGADLLGGLLWKRLREGCAAGEALMKAKHDFIREMTRRQGYLDGEDQKTLLSYVFYGDPLARIAPANRKINKIFRPRTQPKVKIIKECIADSAGEVTMGDHALKDIKKTLEKYLPGIRDAEFKVIQQRVRQPENKKTESKRSVEPKYQERLFVKVSKEVKTINHVHHQYVRATMGTDGKVIKLMLSR